MQNARRVRRKVKFNETTIYTGVLQNAPTHETCVIIFTMKLDTTLYARLLREAADNPRLRQATDLRTSPADQSQRMLNALLPGTAVPIHRHPHSAETAVVLSGCLDEIYFDDKGRETARFTLRAGEGLQIPLGQFHTVEVKEPTILFESKDGAYAPAAPEDIIDKQP